MLNHSKQLDMVCRKIEAGLGEEPTLYNIHKRSLPVGTDKIVGIGFTQKEADWFISARLKPKQFEGLVYYFTMVKQNASPAEQSVFYNEPNTRKVRYDVVE